MKLFYFLPLLFLSAACASAATNYTSPNMGLTIPIPGQELGPAWAYDINGSLTLLDAHDHSPGKGVQITPAGMNITANLSFNGNDATNLGAVIFVAQTVDPTAPASYVKGVDLYYRDGNGNVIQITSGGGVAGSPGSISNLTSPASASYVSAQGTFVWQQATSTAANMDAATLIIRYPGSYPSPSGNYIAIQAPSSLATGYAYTLPATLPGSTSYATINSSGAWSYTTADGIGQAMTSVGANAIGVAMAATGANAVAASRTRSTGTSVGIGGVAISSSSGAYSSSSGSFTAVTNLSVTITTSGRPVMVLLMSDGTGSTTGANFGQTGSGAVAALFQVLRGGTQVSIIEPEGQTPALYPPGALSVIDMPSAGTYTYSITSRAIGSTAVVNNCVLAAYEL